MKRKWDTEDEALQRKCIDEIIARIDEIGGEPAGVIAAQDIIEIVTNNLASEIYNKGVSDAKKILDSKVDDLGIEIDSLRLQG